MAITETTRSAPTIETELGKAVTRSDPRPAVPMVFSRALADSWVEGWTVASAA